MVDEKNAVYHRQRILCSTNYSVSHRNLASRNPPLKTNHRQNVYFRLPDVVTIDLNISLGSRHPLEKNPG
jgi:hypothetical protein